MIVMGCQVSALWAAVWWVVLGRMHHSAVSETTVDQ